MPRQLATALIAVFALTAAGSAFAGEVYKWKDANGAVHYGQKPPAKGAYTVVKVNDVAPSKPAATPAQASASTTAASTAATAAADAKENPSCTRARQNLSVLNGKLAVQMDTDGDGKPDKTLSDAERASQLELANASMKANCTP